MGWAEERLAEARAMMDLPALAHGDAVLMHRTKLHNTFTCQPQQRNMHGRVFGGFLMRRAILTHCTHASTRAVLKDVPQSMLLPYEGMLHLSSLMPRQADGRCKTTISM